MKSTIVAIICLSGVAAAQAPGDAHRGGLLLRQTTCLDCHTFEGSGKGTAPDLGKRTADAFTRTQFASLMWNHAPAMWGMMHGGGQAVPALSVEQVGDLFAHFYSARFFEPAGDAARGKQIFDSHRCSVCHDLHAQKVGPPVSEWKEVSDPAAWIQQMWNHSGAMYAKAKEKKIAWPNLTGQEFSDLLVYLKSLPETRSAKAAFSLSDPQLGKTLFDKKGCTRCHVINSQEANKISIPIHGRPADSLAAVAAMMWNHAPSMNESSKGDLPHFEGTEMNHVLAYLFWAGFFEEPGDPRAGQRVYEKKCAECHAKGEAGAPDLAFLRGRPGASGERGVSAITITSALWKHGPGMLAALKSKSRAWPVFQGAEMADLIAYLNQK
jgi:cytochrome c2